MFTSIRFLAQPGIIKGSNFKGRYAIDQYAGVHIGISDNISVAPSRPAVIITSPSVLVLKPASQYVK